MAVVGVESKDISIEAGDGGKYSYVVRGAILSCSAGSCQSVLQLPISHGVYIKDQAKMNINDFKSMYNVQPFGVCSLKGYPPPPCIPTLTIPWQHGKDDVLVENAASLLNISTLTCMFGGIIKIDDDGQV